MSETEYTASIILLNLMHEGFDLRTSPKSKMKDVICRGLRDAEAKWPEYEREQRERGAA